MNQEGGNELCCVMIKIMHLCRMCAHNLFVHGIYLNVCSCSSGLCLSFCISEAVQRNK